MEFVSCILQLYDCEMKLPGRKWPLKVTDYRLAGKPGYFCMPLLMWADAENNPENPQTTRTKQLSY